MFKKLTTGAMAAVLAASTAFVTPAFALDDAQKEEMGAFIREYLLANPEILQEMQTALQTKQEAEASEKAKAAIIANKDALTADPQDIVLGNPDGDVTIVEFFDYNCGYCKHALEDMNAIIEGDDKVRFVLKEFPILGPDSLAAHRVAMSFRKLMPEKYGEFHRTLLGSDGRATEQSAIDLALKLEEPTNHPVDVQHVLAAVVLAARNGELDPGIKLSSDDQALVAALVPHVHSVFEKYDGEVGEED